MARSATRIDPDQAVAFVDYSSQAGPRRVVGLEGWEKNAAGIWFSPTYGFGLIDVNRALQRAATHTSLPPLVQLPWQKGVTGSAEQASIPDVGSAPTSSSAYINRSLKVEAVQVSVSLDHDRLSDLLIELVSPSGTRSVLLNPYNGFIGRAIDKNTIGLTFTTGMNKFRMLSNKFYGENSAGEWKLQVTDVSNSVRNIRKVIRTNGAASTITESNNTKPGKLQEWSLRILGH